MTLVHPVESFKDPLLLFFRDTDTIILHTVIWMASSLPYKDLYDPIFIRIAYCIVRNIVQHLIEDLTHTLDGN